MIKTLPQNLTTVLDMIVLGGGVPIVVGGSVRDHFFGKSCSDYDVEVYHIATLEQLIEILKSFGTVNFVGKSFGILKLSVADEVYDFSFPRTENKIGLGHKEFAVTISSTLSFKEAARRRDFAINAIGYDYNSKEFLDPYGGRGDIENKLLKHIDDESFIEDPLRVYRAIQLCGRFELVIDDGTKKLCRSLVKGDEFGTLSKERVFGEYEKLLLYSQKPSVGLRLITELGIVNIDDGICKNIDAMVEYKTENQKDNLVLLFYFIFDILVVISDDKKLIKTIQNLQKFEVPKIYEKKLVNITNSAEEISVKYNIMKNMPQPLLVGKDLIDLGYKPSIKFGVVLKKVYQSQLDGEILDKKEAEQKLYTLL